MKKIDAEKTEEYPVSRIRSYIRKPGINLYPAFLFDFKTWNIMRLFNQDG